jgi:hypothetical protein
MERSFPDAPAVSKCMRFKVKLVTPSRTSIVNVARVNESLTLIPAPPAYRLQDESNAIANAMKTMCHVMTFLEFRRYK